MSASIGYVFFIYVLPLISVVGGWLLMRDYGYPVVLESLAYWLLMEAKRSRDRQAKNRDSLLLLKNHLEQSIKQEAADSRYGG